MKKVVRYTIWIPSDNPSLMRAQLAAFTKQVPLLYFILCVNAAALAFAFREVAPPLLTVGVSSGLFSVCLARLIVWAKTRDKALSDRAVAKRLIGTIFIGAAIGVAFLAWALALFPYGDARAQDQVTFFVGITVVSCVFCLMHLRPAALLLALTIVVPFTAFLLTTGDANLISIGVNLVLVSLAMAYVLVVASRDFSRLIISQAETRRLSDENARLANVDALTGLPNRRRFFAELNRTVEDGQKNGTGCAVGVIDLDGFKLVNDRFGHVVGDRVLAESGERLRLLSSDTAFMARLGGDEFGIILKSAQGETDLLAFGDQVCTALSTPYEFLGSAANISASIGFAIFPDNGTTPSSLYERADYALYHAKGRDRGRPVLFSNSHESAIRNGTMTEDRLRSADLEAEMSLHFQPVYDTHAKRVVAFEALARWTPPGSAEVSPSVFIPAAERIGLINKISQTLLRKALQAASAWPDDLRLSFNLSARDLMSAEAMLQIAVIIRNSPIAPHRVGIEITEACVVADFGQAHASLLMLKSLGVEILLDDFGTGYSSLSHVHRLPLDTIKVDRSLVHDMEATGDGRSLVKSVVDLCQNLGIGCVVEGIETAAQADTVKALGCAMMQGYFFGKPMAQDQILDLLGSTRERIPGETAGSLRTA